MICLKYLNKSFAGLEIIIKLNYNHFVIFLFVNFKNKFIGDMNET